MWPVGSISWDYFNFLFILLGFEMISNPAQLYSTHHAKHIARCVIAVVISGYCFKSWLVISAFSLFLEWHLLIYFIPMGSRRCALFINTTLRTVTHCCDRVQAVEVRLYSCRWKSILAPKGLNRSNINVTKMLHLSHLCYMILNRIFYLQVFTIWVAIVIFCWIWSK